MLYEVITVIDTVAISVKVLAVIRHLHVGIGRKEPSQQRVVHPSVHINDAKFGQMLMSCVATGKANGVLAHRLPAPGVVCRVKYRCAIVVGQRQNTSQVVVMGVVNFIALPGLFHIYSCQAIAATNIVKLAGGAVQLLFSKNVWLM